MSIRGRYGYLISALNQYPLRKRLLVVSKKLRHRGNHPIPIVQLQKGQ